MRKKLIVSVCVVIVILLTSVVLIYRNNNAKADNGTYATAAAQYGTIEYSIDGSGTIQPKERYALKTWAGGTVTEVMVTAGTQVKAGQPLMSIKNESLESKARQAALEWEIAQNDLNDMYYPPDESDYDRRAAELKVEQYKIALEEILVDKDNLVLKAPFDGKILDIELYVGEKVSAGTLAVSVATTDEIEVVAEFSADVINSLAVGMDAQTYVKGLNKTYTGKVKEIAFEGSSTTSSSLSTSGTFEVLIALDASDEDLRPGMETYNTVILAKDDDNDIFIYKQASGYLRYTQSEDMETEVSGTVAEIYCQEGDVIKKGDPILGLTNDEIDRQVKEAENELAQAEEDLALFLHPDEDTIKQQQIKVEQNYQEVLTTKEQLDSLNVVSPIDGVVVSIAVNAGDELGEDDTSVGQELVVVCNFEKNILEIEVDELDINKLDFGQQATVEIDALPDEVVSGTVTGIAQEGTTSDGVTTYPVTLEIGYVEGIKGGMSATATILLDKRENVLLVAAEAVTTVNNQSTVQVVENGKINSKTVKIGLNNGELVEITEGLTEGEEVIVAQTSATTSTTQMMPGGMGGPPSDGGGPGGPPPNGN